MTVFDPQPTERTNDQRDPLPPASPSALLRCNRIYLAVEFFLIFIMGPFVLVVFRHSFAMLLIPALLLVSGVCLLLLLKDPSFDRQSLYRISGFDRWLKGLPVIFLPCSVSLLIATAVFRPELLFAFPRNNTITWLLVMVLYPLLSVYPQEIIFRTFFFHRYHLLFPNDLSKIVVSGLCFGLAHLFFANWIAPVLSTLGGLIFARTYARSYSTIVVSLEHGLWGNILFTIGLGWYFYAGSISG